MTGARLVRMIWQASRLHYAVFREIKFEGIHLDRAVAQTLLDTAIGIADALSDAALLPLRSPIADISNSNVCLGMETGGPGRFSLTLFMAQCGHVTAAQR